VVSVAKSLFSERTHFFLRALARADFKLTAFIIVCFINNFYIFSEFEIIVVFR